MSRDERIKEKRFTRVLMISPVFAPKADSEAFCGGKLALGLLKRDIEVAVLTLNRYDDLNQIQDESEMWHILKGITYVIATPPIKKLSDSIKNALRYQTLTYSRWISSAIESAKSLHEKEKFDFVYSRSLPMISNIVGYWVSKILDVPWVANMNDPWDWHLFPHIKREKKKHLYELLSNYWLKKTIKNADLITYPSDRLWRYHEKVSGIAHKAEVISHIG